MLRVTQRIDGKCANCAKLFETAAVTVTAQRLVLSKTEIQPDPKGTFKFHVCDNCFYAWKNKMLD